MKYLGIDYGSRKIGLALSDDMGTLAFPYRVIAQNAETIDVILGLITSENVGVIIVGHSVDGRGKENLVMQEIYTFIDHLKIKTKVPIHMINEYGSTGGALALQEFMLQRPRNQDRKTALPEGYIDDAAAAILLQRYLDTH